MVDFATRLTAALGGRYVVERELGAGGMANVYLGEDTRQRRKVAVKVLRPELAAALGRDRFLREIEIVSHLTHPHILPLHDSGITDDDLCYYVMPYVDGETLRDRLDREGQLPIDDAVRYACEIADALAYAHARGVVHRDIKPQNIMLEAGHAVVADFGIALAADTGARQRLTDTGHSLGTPEYMSPEQASANQRLDGRSDVYSLGCVLYEMLVGNPPFTGPSIFAILARHAAEKPPSIRIVRETVPERLERICFRAIAKSPADRFASAEEFRRALVQLQHEAASANDASLRAPPSDASDARRRSPADADSATDGAGRTLWVRTGELALRFIPLTVGAATTLIVLGFLTVSVHDSQLHLPPAYSPSETNYLVVGARSLVFPGLTAVVAAVIAFAAFFLVGQAFRACERLPLIGRPLCSIHERVAARWDRFREQANPVAAANVLLVATILAAGAGLAYAAPFLAAVFASDASALGCESRFARWSYQPFLGLLIAILAGIRFGVLRWIRHRTGGLRRVTVARFGSAALIFLLLVAAAVPWKLVIARGKERVRIGDHRGYVLHETGDELVLYNASLGTTASYPKSDTPAYERLGITGYVFEEPVVFDSGRQKCDVVYDRYR